MTGKSTPKPISKTDGRIYDVAAGLFREMMLPHLMGDVFTPSVTSSHIRAMGIRSFEIASDFHMSYRDWKTGTGGTARRDVGRVIARWRQYEHEEVGKGLLPLPQRVVATIRIAIAATLVEVNADSLLEVIDRASKSPFLRGQNERNWRPDILWVANSRAAILLGRYDDKGGASGFDAVFKGESSDT